MSYIRILIVLAVGGALSPSCKGAAEATCASVCNKAETCGDTNSVDANQCRTSCAANADVAQATLNTCMNKSDIVSATSQCLDRACSDYQACLITLPSCNGDGSVTSGGAGGNSGGSGIGGSGIGGSASGIGGNGNGGSGSTPACSVSCAQAVTTGDLVCGVTSAEAAYVALRNCADIGCPSECTAQFDNGIGLDSACDGCLTTSCKTERDTCFNK